MKALRHRELTRLLEAEAIGSLDELRAKLENRGIVVSVATLSRDLRRLGAERAARIDEAGGLRRQYTLPRERGKLLSLQELTARFTVSSTVVASLFLVRTLPGYGPLLAAGVENAAWPEVLAMVASDRAVIGVCQSNLTANAVVERLRDMRRQPEA